MICWRYPEMKNGLDELDASDKKDTIDLKAAGKLIARAVQHPQKNAIGK